MKFSRNAPIILITVAVAVIFSISIISNIIFSRMTSLVEAGQLNLMQSIIEFNFKQAEDHALAGAAMIADLPKTRSLFAEQDRKGLLAEYQKMFIQQKEKYGIDQSQFHLPPATSFLRLNDPEKYGDDLSKFRPLIAAVNRDQIPGKGFAIARSGPAIFGIVPVFDVQDKHLGSFEIGIAFNGILDVLKAAYGLEMAVFINEEALKDLAKGVGSSIYSEQNRVGKFIRYHSTNVDLLSKLIFDKDLNRLENHQFTRTALGLPYGVVLVPLRTGTGDVLGMVAAVSDFSTSRSAQSRSKIWQALMALISIVLISVIIIVTIRGVLLAPVKIISAHFGGLARGEAGSKLPEPELFCEELKELAQHYEKLLKAMRREGA